MAKKNDRKEYNKLKKKKADNKKQQEQCRSEIDVLDEKNREAESGIQEAG